jgi:hypothetical protein
MHVPKCAGVALSRSLAQATGAKSRLHGLDGTLFGTFDDFASIAESIRRHIYLSGMPDRGCHDLIDGHFSLSSLASFRDGRFVTIMREPRCRLISHFLYWRGQSEDELLAWGAWSERVRLAHGRLLEFLANQTLASQIDNLFTRFLLCPHADIPTGAFIPPELHDELYHEAYPKLQQFGLVDLLENPAMEQNIQKWLGREFHMIEDNVSAPRMDLPVSLAEELTVDALTRVWSLSAIDRRLWKHTARRMNAFADPEVHADALFVAMLRAKR